MTKPVTKPVSILDKNTKNGQCVAEAAGKFSIVHVCSYVNLKFVVSVSVTVSGESVSQIEFRYRYWTETKIVVSVVH